MKIVKFIPAILLTLLSFTLDAQVAVRGGLPNFFDKIERAEEVAVAYFGGSITAQAGWRVQSLNYLKEEYPKAKFRELNATIGGTGSDLGALRINYDVFRQEPDLLFVEFAVNDSRTDSLVILNSMEGIVRKTWERYPYCDICFVYTFHKPLLEELLAGEYNLSVRVMELVAERYNIPTVHLGSEALKLIKSGEMEISTPKGVQTKVSGNELNKSFTPQTEEDGKIYFSPDGVHPFLNTGHVLYTRAFIDALNLYKEVGAKEVKHKVRKAISKENREFSTPAYIDQNMLEGDWSVVEKSYFGSKYKQLWSGKRGAKIKFEFSGSTLIAYDLIGPGSCKLRITIDGESREVNRFDGHCTYWRISSFVVAEKLDPKRVHSVEIEVLELEDKRDILFEQNQANYDNNTKPYVNTEWQIGNFFILEKGGSLSGVVNI
ncbi:MAG: SGNH/GDSL hydrolase family protein [Rikenellaceae bacterium]